MRSHEKEKFTGEWAFAQGNGQTQSGTGGTYAISQQKRKLIEQGFGWAKFVGPIRQAMVRGLKKVDQLFVLTMAAYNLTRMRSLGQIRLQMA
jgi:hypothetical protein